MPSRVAYCHAAVTRLMMRHFADAADSHAAPCMFIQRLLAAMF